MGYNTPIRIDRGVGLRDSQRPGSHFKQDLEGGRHGKILGNDSGRIRATFVERGGDCDFTAYNDVCYSSTSGHPALQPNVTTYNIGSGSPGPAGGLLLDKSTGTSTGVTVTLTQSGSVVWQPDPVTGAATAMRDRRTKCLRSATTASLMGTVYYGSTGWWVDVSFTGLNPAATYEFVTTANRNDATYTDRLTKYTISGADAYTNASSTGTTIGSGGVSTTLCTGYNTVNGYVARWTGINPGADGSFTVRAEAGSSQYKAYAFDAFKLVEVPPRLSGSPRWTQPKCSRPAPP